MQAKAHVRVARFAALSSALLLAAGLSACGGGAGTSLPPAAQKQDSTAQSQRSIETVQDAGAVDAADTGAAASARVVYRHVWKRFSGASTAIGNAPGRASTPPDAPGGRLIDHGGARLATVASHDVYVNCNDPASCWGFPAQFLQNLEASNFIHVTDQYIGTFSNFRYTVAAAQKIKYSIPLNVLYDADVQEIVHHVAKQRGGGYANEYHVFLPQGTDECFDGVSGICYSPDNLSTFVFCAYHGSVDFADIGHILYSVEPYQETPGCGDVFTPTNYPPHSGPPPHTLTDSTSTVLSHELFETITDPDGTAWFNADGFEIGDLCAFHRAIINLDGTNYTIQTEWSNAASHGQGDCVSQT